MFVICEQQVIQFEGVARVKNVRTRLLLAIQQTVSQIANN